MDIFKERWEKEKGKIEGMLKVVLINFNTPIKF